MSPRKQQKDNKKGLTNVAKIILSVFEEEKKAFKPEELSEKLGMKIRSIRYGLKILQDEEIITRYPDLSDLRSFYYVPINQITHQNPIKALI